MYAKTNIMKKPYLIALALFALVGLLSWLSLPFIHHIAY
jgi:hypothetical protein